MVGKKESVLQENHHEQTNVTQKLFAVNALVTILRTWEAHLKKKVTIF